MYDNFILLFKIFCIMNVVIVLFNLFFNFIVCRYSGMIFVFNKKLIISVSFIFISVSIIFSDVNRRYLNGCVLFIVFKNGYKNNGMCVVRNNFCVLG